ncbi:Hpt domain-containing protein [Candidatus Synechococcus calcipolaris G9]|uniref:Hpt domain-containing protein n=1 Tax=Candidatus Synechococcus calcipolaris G9 TaxID=1497997 RepID=A0ABT6EZ66_9SYNE|nr:Hpt domain-containing protein [Candidatus Synechococcus calcipolaris]MDG2990830.1 Hpt domain-containing protein [Candidatus Synechococcus calcipolaris G9]
MGTDALIDWDYLSQLSGGDTEFEQELLLTFVEDAQLHLSAAKTALADNNIDQIKREAHHLKGSGGNVGATTIQGLATELEQQAKENDLSEAGSLIANMESICQGIAALVAEKYTGS